MQEIGPRSGTWPETPASIRWTGKLEWTDRVELFCRVSFNCGSTCEVEAYARQQRRNKTWHNRTKKLEGR